MSNTVKIAENDTHLLKIVQDDGLHETPRDWDNIGTMICFHRKYDLGDKHSYSDSEEFIFALAEELGMEIDYDDEYVLSKAFNYIEINSVILPLYLYDHSGITMSTGKFSCPWDSGQVGWIYVTHEDIIKEYSKLDIENARGSLEAEVKAYDQYLTGDVYGFVLEKKNNCDCCGNVENEHVDSCWGFYGLDYLEEELTSHIGHEYDELVKNLKWAN